MKRTIIGVLVGGALVGLGNFGYGVYQDIDRNSLISEMQSEPPAHWLEVSVHVDDAKFGAPPIAGVSFTVHHQVIVRVTISPHDVETGRILCAGRTVDVIYEPGPLMALRTPLGALAGQRDCPWPVGRYSASITFSLIDAKTNVLLKPIAIETNDFNVTP